MVQYRATDKSGNVGAIKTLAFTVENRDVTTVYRLRRGRLAPWKPDAHPGAPGRDRHVALRHPATGRRGDRGAQPLRRAAGRRPPDRQRAASARWSSPRAARRSPTSSTSRASGRSTASIHRSAHGRRRSEVGAPRPDTAAPTTTATVTGDGTVAATVNLSASDNSSGVAYIDYAVNSTLPADGSEGAGVTRLTNTDGTDPFEREFQFTSPGDVHGRVPRGRPCGQPRGGQDAVGHRRAPGGPGPRPGRPTPLPGPFPPPPTPDTPKAERDRVGGQEHRDGHAARIPGDAGRAGAQHGHRGLGPGPRVRGPRDQVRPPAALDLRRQVPHGDRRGGQEPRP